MADDPHILFHEWESDDKDFNAWYVATDGRGWCKTCMKLRKLPTCPESENFKEDETDAS